MLSEGPTFLVFFSGILYGYRGAGKTLTVAYIFSYLFSFFILMYFLLSLLFMMIISGSFFQYLIFLCRSTTTIHFLLFQIQPSSSTILDGISVDPRVLRLLCVSGAVRLV